MTESERQTRSLAPLSLLSSVDQSSPMRYKLGRGLGCNELQRLASRSHGPLYLVSFAPKHSKQEYRRQFALAARIGRWMKLRRACRSSLERPQLSGGSKLNRGYH